MFILLLRITTLFLDPRVSRHHICRYWSNRRSRKFFVNCVNFSVNNLNYEQNLHKVTHIAKCLRKMYNNGSNLHLLHKSLCILEYLRYFVGNLILLRFTLTCVNCLGTKLWTLNIFDKYDVWSIGSRNLHTGCDELTVATDRQRHEDQEYSSPRAHCKCNDQGICVFLYLCIYVCADSHWSRTVPWWRPSIS